MMMTEPNHEGISYHHPVDDIEPDVTEDSLRESASNFRRVWMWAARAGGPREIGIRHLVSACLLGQRPEIRTLNDLAKLCRVTRAETSRVGTEFSKTFGIKFTLQNPLSTREKCRRNRSKKQ